MTAPTFSRAGSAPVGVTLVVGGGSGIGRAIALELAAAGHRVVVAGRRKTQLTETVDLVDEAGGTATALELDITEPGAVTQSLAQVAEEIGPITTLVCSAGTNVTRRWWSDLDPADFTRIVDTNLNAVTRCVTAVLPGMRARGLGQIVVVSSWAGWRYMSVAGAAYGASKTALSFLVETLNDQEGRHGIRATLLCPGEVDTPILKTRPTPVPQEEIDKMLLPDNVAAAVGWVCSQPAGVCVNELVLTPTWNRIYLAGSGVPVEPS